MSILLGSFPLNAIRMDCAPIPMGKATLSIGNSPSRGGPPWTPVNWLGHRRLDAAHHRMVLGKRAFECQHHPSIIVDQQAIRCLGTFRLRPSEVGQEPLEAKLDKAVGTSKQ